MNESWDASQFEYQENHIDGQGIRKTDRDQSGTHLRCGKNTVFRIVDMQESVVSPVTKKKEILFSNELPDKYTILFTRNKISL